MTVVRWKRCKQVRKFVVQVQGFEILGVYASTRAALLPWTLKASAAGATPAADFPLDVAQRSSCLNPIHHRAIQVPPSHLALYISFSGASSEQALVSMLLSATSQFT